MGQVVRAVRVGLDQPTRDGTGRVETRGPVGARLVVTPSAVVVVPPRWHRVSLRRTVLRPGDGSVVTRVLVEGARWATQRPDDVRPGLAIETPTLRSPLYLWLLSRGEADEVADAVREAGITVRPGVVRRRHEDLARPLASDVATLR